MYNYFIREWWITFLNFGGSITLTTFGVATEQCLGSYRFGALNPPAPRTFEPFPRWFGLTVSWSLLDFSIIKLLKMACCSLQALVYFCAPHSKNPSGGPQLLTRFSEFFAPERFWVLATRFDFQEFTLCNVQFFEKTFFVNYYSCFIFCFTSSVLVLSSAFRASRLLEMSGSCKIFFSGRQRSRELSTGPLLGAPANKSFWSFKKWRIGFAFTFEEK